MSGIPLISGSVELGAIDIPASGLVELDLPEHLISKLENGWASVRPLFLPCPPDASCKGYRTCIDRLRIIGT